VVLPRLADHDVESLARLLVEGGGRSLASCRRTATKALGYAFKHDAEGDVAWTDEALCHAELGAWARPLLLTLSPRIGLEIAERAPASDGAVRLLLRTIDGRLVESVIIPAEAGRDRARCTLCLSSQVGCARACAFCETGAHGLERQLSAAEIVDQVRLCRRLAPERPLSNIVFMGMGEPFDNLRSVSRAIEHGGDRRQDRRVLRHHARRARHQPARPR
jgi:23S rRNA (adenine2503-C2)-methyltransferase